MDDLFSRAVASVNKKSDGVFCYDAAMENSPETMLVLTDVAEERLDQRRRHGTQYLPDGTGEAWDDVEREAAQHRCDVASRSGAVSWRLVLEEEVAEAFAETDPAALRAELVQVAAVAVQWIEALDRRSRPR